MNNSQLLPDEVLEYLGAVTGESNFMVKAVPWVREFLNAVSGRWPRLVQPPILSIGVSSDASLIGCNFDAEGIHIEVEFAEDEDEGNTVFFAGLGFSDVVEFTDPKAAMLVASRFLGKMNEKHTKLAKSELIKLGMVPPVDNEEFLTNKNWCFPPPAEGVCRFTKTMPSAMALKLGMSARDFAKLQRGETEIDEGLAVSLSAAAYGTKEFWLNKEQLYREDLLRFAAKKEGR